MSTDKNCGCNKGSSSTPSGNTPLAFRPVPLPEDFEEKAKLRYEAIRNPEISFQQYLGHEKAEFQRRKALESAAASYKPVIGTKTPCGNGDFEKLLDSAEWQGAFGVLPTYVEYSNNLPISYSPINFGALTPGIFSGPVDNFASHQTWEPKATDPTLLASNPSVTLSTTAPTTPPSLGAIRIGNAVNGGGCELLSKTFIVTAAQSQINFWYALVFQDPGHKQPDPPRPGQTSFPPPTTGEQPFFWVRVTDANSNIVPGAIQFANGRDYVWADKTNPFFQTTTGKDNQTITYKDWACAQIDLSTQVGKQVTIEFITGDCGQGGHWGYAYIDNFCGSCAGSPEGDLTYDAEASTSCGAGQLCFNYTLPHKGTTTGSIAITLDIYQNGQLLTTLLSPTLTSGNQFCFNIDPAAIPGINPKLGGFDFVATGDFDFGATNLSPIKVGVKPDGVEPGQNNDYRIACQRYSYSVKFVCGKQQESECGCSPVRPGVYSTEINIHNYQSEEAVIEKRLIPVVLADAPIGREPRFAGTKAVDHIKLPPDSATMDDCCRIADLLQVTPSGASMPLTIGFLEIISNVELNVTAVYTASDLKSNGLTLDVETINPRLK